MHFYLINMLVIINMIRGMFPNSYSYDSDSSDDLLPDDFYDRKTGVKNMLYEQRMSAGLTYGERKKISDYKELFNRSRNLSFQNRGYEDDEDIPRGIYSDYCWRVNHNKSLGVDTKAENLKKEELKRANEGKMFRMGNVMENKQNKYNYGGRFYGDGKKEIVYNSCVNQNENLKTTKKERHLFSDISSEDD